MIRVLHAIGSLNAGGSQAFVMNMYRHIDRSQIQFDFVIEHPGELHHASEIMELGGRVFELQPFEGKNFHAYRLQWKHLLSEYSEWRILHSHVRSTAAIYIRIAKQFGMRTIQHSHSTSNGTGIQALLKNVMQYPVRYQADCLVACSTEAGKWLYGRRAINSSKYVLMPNAIEISRYRPNVKVREKIRSELGLTDKFVCGHVGRFHESKNHLFLINAFQEISKTNRHAHLILVGDGKLRTVIEDEIERLNLNHSVTLLGSRDNVDELLQAMDVFLFPSKWEGFPVAVVEALASGLPCYISDTITHDIDICDSVFRLPIDSPKDWRIIGFLKERVNVEEQLNSAGFEIAESANDLVELYRKLLDYSNITL